MCPFQPPIGQAQEYYYPNTNLYVHTFPSYGIQVLQEEISSLMEPLYAHACPDQSLYIIGVGSRGGDDSSIVAGRYTIVVTISDQQTSYNTIDSPPTSLGGILGNLI